MYIIMRTHIKRRGGVCCCCKLCFHRTLSLLGRARNAIICQLSRPLSMYKHRADLQKMTYDAICANLILGGAYLCEHSWDCRNRSLTRRRVCAVETELCFCQCDFSVRCAAERELIPRERRATDTWEMPLANAVSRIKFIRDFIAN